jgi:hypothetical protein
MARRLGDRGVVATPRSVDELHRVAEAFRAQRIGILGIAGGDGTNQVTLTGFRTVYGASPLPTVALLRGGTMNTLANAVGVPAGRSEGLLDRLVRAALEAPPLPVVERNTLDVNGRLGFLFGTGIVYGFLREYYDTGAPSPWTAARTLARCVGSAFVGGPMIRRMMDPVHIAVDHGRGDAAGWAERAWLSVAAGTIADIGLGFRPFHRYAEREACFHLLGIHTGPVGFAVDLPRIHAARGMRGDKCMDALTAEGRLRFASGQGRYMLDGDLFEEPGEVTVKLGPRVRIATLAGTA